MRRIVVGTVIGTLVVGLLGFGGVIADPGTDDPTESKPNKDRPVAATGPEDVKDRHFMREKLTASQKVLEGLTTDDFAMVSAGAKKLHTLTTEEQWRVRNDPMYRQFSGEYRTKTKALIDAAEKKNQSEMTLKWVSVTMSCIDCHNFVRGIRVTDVTDRFSQPEPVR